jgi:hypothetical protein
MIQPENVEAVSTNRTEIRIKGKDLVVPTLRACDRTLVVTGKWLKTAVVKDEAFVQGEIVPDPEQFVAEIKKWDVWPDLFAFPQKIDEPKRDFPYHTEWENFAVIRTTSYEDWLKKIKRDVKENLRRSRREGVVVRATPFDDNLVQAIKGLYDETPIRQGRPFWHYGKSFDAIKELKGTYPERAEFVCAYLGEELIGFIKMVYVDNFAKTMHVFTQDKHFHKRPANALIAKAVEICAEKGLSHFIYGEFHYPGKKENSLTEFKHRNGFEEVKYPRYFIPLTSKGRLAIQLSLHRGIQPHMPAQITNTFIALRSAYYKKKFADHLASVRAD